MKLIPLTQGYSAMVDDEDFEWLMQWKWRASVKSNTVYAITGIKCDGRRTSMLMHRAILRVTDSKIDVDHGDGNGLNNRRENIRPCTHAQNLANSGSRGGSSKFKGVCWSKGNNRWSAAINIGGRIKHIGYFEKEEDAARSYNQFAEKHHKGFAQLNDVTPVFPDKEWVPLVLFSRNTSGFRGVCFNKRMRKWKATIGFNAESFHLGYFFTALDGAKAYDEKAKDLLGDKAILNFP